MNSQKDFADQVRVVLEKHPEGLPFRTLLELGGLTKGQAKTGIAYLRRANRSLLLSYEGGIVKLVNGPEDAMRVVANRLEALAEEVVLKLYGVDLLVEQHGVSKELQELCRTAVQATKRIDHALRFLDVLEGEEG